MANLSSGLYPRGVDLGSARDSDRANLTRGGHAREDYPNRDDANFLQHTMAYKLPDGGVKLDYKPVVITRYQPMERKY